MAETKTEPPQQACPSCDTPVSVAEVEPLARLACPNCGHRFRAASTFDYFELLETVGVGGMGSVYKARDTRLDRFVALKLLRKELSADPAEAARLEQEARVTAAVNHPNVVQVYSTGTAHGQIYLVMELVDHGSLDDLMAQQPRVPEAQVLETAIQVAKGLQAAHEKGLIHRDIKPANILFADPQTAKIGDFGLALAAGQQAEAEKEIWGTPYYVAPERLNNEPEDFRSDIYSLGATLYHALAGHPPIEGETTSASELRRLKAISPDLRRIAPDVSRETARLVNRMLAPDPRHRFTSYAQLVDGLQRARRALPDMARGAKGRRGLLIAALAIALLAAGAAYYFYRGKPAPVSAVGTPTPAPTPDNTAVVQRRYEEARRQLIEGKYDPAATAFTRLAAEAANRQPLLSWIQIHRGLAALMQGKTGPARDAFRELEKPNNFSKADAELARWFTDTGKLLATPGPIRGPAAEIDAKSPQAFATFLFAVKNWQIGEFAEGAAHFERYIAADAAGEFAWINDYKPMARTFLEDHRVFTEWKQMPSRFNSSGELRNAVANVRRLEARLKMQGALRDTLRDETKRLNGLLAEREKSEKQAAEAERARILEQETPAWNAALAEARRRASVYDFAGAAQAIDGTPVTVQLLKDAQATERKRLGWLADWKTTLINDLRTGRYTAAITELPGVEYEGVATATQEEITLRIPGNRGSAPVRWTALKPRTLLGMSLAFILPTAPEAADRQWLAAVFAHETGQAEEAKQLSDAAVKARPAYREQLGALKATPAPSLGAAWNDGASPAPLERMRTLICAVILSLAAGYTASAKPSPLTVKEVSLMLRSGYSVAAVEAELAKRHFIESVDATAEKTLVAAGATPALIDGLRGGAYAVPPEQIAAAQAELEAQAKRKALQAEEARNMNTLYQAKIAQERLAAAAAGPVMNGNKIADLVKGDLVTSNNGILQVVNDQTFEKKKLIALYFSGRWCPSCRKFTPQLVDYYNRVAAAHPEFEVVFVSSDRSGPAMEEYMRESKMPWPAVKYEKIAEKEELRKYKGDGIPCLVLVDSGGRVISDSYAGKNYLGPDKVLRDLDQLFGGAAPAPVAQR